MGIRWQITPVATWVGFKEPLSLAFSQSGRPGIAFYADLNAQLSYYLLDEDTGFWIASPVETGIYAGVGVYPSLKFRNNRPAISYSVQEDPALVGNYELRYAHFTGALPWEIVHVGRPTGWTGTSLAFDPTGRPGISFYLPEGHGIGFVHSPSNFSVWTGSTPDSQAASSHVSLAFTSSGRPAIAYQGYTGDGETTPEIRYAVFDGRALDRRKSGKARSLVLACFRSVWRAGHCLRASRSAESGCVVCIPQPVRWLASQEGCRLGLSPFAGIHTFWRSCDQLRRPRFPGRREIRCL
jgi:hypothetical protein